MADKKTVYHCYEHDMSDSPATIMEGFVSFLAGFGLQKTGEMTFTDCVYQPVLTFSNNPNIGIYLAATNASQLTIAYGVAFKGANGKWKQVGGSAFGTNTSQKGLYLGVRTISGITRYGIDTFYNKNTVISESAPHDGTFQFGNANLVDYFTSKQRNGIFADIVHGYSMRYFGYYVYNEDTHSAEELTKTSHNHYTSEVSTIASPLILASNSFYGYIKSSSATYFIRKNGSDLGNIGDGIVTVGGCKFQQLLYKYGTDSNLYVRI